MATKQNIINKVDTDLASGGNIQATDHRGVLHGTSDSLIENFYGIVTTDNSNTSSPSNTGIVTPIDSNQNYGLDITKNGNRVNISGSIRNDSGSILPVSTLFFTITDTEYLMQVSSGDSSFYGVACKGISLSGAYEDITLRLAGNVLSIKDAMPINSIYKFSLTYNTIN